MKLSTLLFFCLLTLVFASCTNNKPDLSNVVNDFANLECRAMMLREQRFTLANQMRFTEDTVIKSNGSAKAELQKLRLEAMKKQKESLLQNSLALADTIHHVLDSLMSNQLADKKNKDEFNQMLNNTLKKRGCVDQNANL